MTTLRARERGRLVMMQMRRALDALLPARETLMTCPGPHHRGMNSTRKGRMPCSQIIGKLAVSTSLGVLLRTRPGGLSGEVSGVTS